MSVPEPSNYQFPSPSQMPTPAHSLKPAAPHVQCEKLYNAAESPQLDMEPLTAALSTVSILALYRQSWLSHHIIPHSPSHNITPTVTGRCYRQYRGGDGDDFSLLEGAHKNDHDKGHNDISEVKGWVPEFDDTNSDNEPKRTRTDLGREKRHLWK